MQLPVVPLIAPLAGIVSSRRRGGPRSRTEIDEERKTLRDKTAAEIDALASEHEARLSRSSAVATGAIYARYSTKFQDSISDQVRTLLNDAEGKSIFVPREHILFDMAVKGCKSNRAGLNALRAILSARKASALLLFSTNRLFRKAYKAIEFVDQAVREWGTRCIFVKDKIDTEDKKGWEPILHLHTMMDQFYTGAYAENVRAAQAGLFKKGLVFGTVTFGYKGVAVEGQLNKRKLPRMALAIDPEAAPWVVKIFQWFTVDRLSMEEISHRLNANPEAPLLPKCSSGYWSRIGVRQVLSNCRYRGLWRYGEKEAIWLSSKDYSHQVVRDIPLEEAQFENLRIVSDELWFAAQQILANSRAKAGRMPRDGDRKSRPRILNGLFWCPEHDRPLQVGGPNGKSMQCPQCRGIRPDVRPLFTQLNRETALRLTCEKLADLVRADDELVSQIIGVCQSEAAASQTPDICRVPKLKEEIAKLTRTIEFNMRLGGVTDFDEDETIRVLKQLRFERDKLQRELVRLGSASATQIAVPTDAEVRQLLAGFAKVLLNATEANAGEEAGKVREIVELLTGGKIVLHQRGERRPHGGWLQGKFKCSVINQLAQQLVGANISAYTPEIEIDIDYKHGSSIAKQADQAKALRDAGLSHRQVGKKLGCGLSKAMRLADYWYRSRGLPVPKKTVKDGKVVSNADRPIAYKEISEQVHEMRLKAISVSRIALTLNYSTVTIARADRFWYESRDLPVLTNDERRKRLYDEMERLYSEGLGIREIAEKLDVTPRWTTLMLRDRCESRGEKFVDGRTRRFSKAIPQPNAEPTPAMPPSGEHHSLP